MTIRKPSLLKGEAMNIRKRGNRYELRAFINGVQKSFSGSSENEVKKRYRDYKKKYELPPKRKPSQRCDMTVSEYVDYYLVTYKYETVKYSTYDRLESCYLNHIKDDDLGNLMLRKVTTDDLQKYFNRKKSELSVSSLKKIKEVLLPCFVNAISNDYMLRNPMDGVRLPTEKNVDYSEEEEKVLIYTDEEIKKILSIASSEYLISNAKRYRYAPMFIFILNTGLRIGECVAIKWCDIDFENKLLKIRRGATVFKDRENNKKVQVISTVKTEKGVRTIPLNNTAIKMLIEMKYRNQRSGLMCEFCFPSYNETALNIRSVQDTFRSICRDIGVDCKGLHALRHTFGSILIRNGVDIKVVSEILGHTSVKFTYDKYIHVINEQKMNAVQMFDVGESYGLLWDGTPDSFEIPAL